MRLLEEVVQMLMRVRVKVGVGVSDCVRVRVRRIMLLQLQLLLLLLLLPLLDLKFSLRFVGKAPRFVIVVIPGVKFALVRIGEDGAQRRAPRAARAHDGIVLIEHSLEHHRRVREAQFFVVGKHDAFLFLHSRGFFLEDKDDHGNDECRDMGAVIRGDQWEG